jgi:hypothetical protein
VTGNATSNATSNATQAAAQTGQINIHATSTLAPAQVGSFVPRQGNQYVFYNVTLDNVNATSRPASLLFFAAHDTANNTYGTDPATFDPSIHGFPAATLTRPGDVVNGVVVFQVPQNTTVTTLTYNDRFSEETISL